MTINHQSFAEICKATQRIYPCDPKNCLAESVKHPEWKLILTIHHISYLARLHYIIKRNGQTKVWSILYLFNTFTLYLFKMEMVKFGQYYICWCSGDESQRGNCWYNFDSDNTALDIHMSRYQATQHVAG